MSNELQDARALVTGAASGIGRAIAVAFAREGATVAVHARDADRARETLEEISQAGGKAFPIAADLSDSLQIEKMCAAAIDRLGGIDIVVNNAGVAAMARVVDMEESLWDQTMTINLKAPFLVSKHTMPQMLEQKHGGSLLFIASTNGKTADAEWTAYNSSKHGLLGFAKCLAAEMGPEGIRVNAICPGWIETKMATDLHKTLAEQSGKPFAEIYDESMRFNMMSALIPSQDIADMAVYLSGARGRYITGQAINVDAGLCYW